MMSVSVSFLSRNKDSSRFYSTDIFNFKAFNTFSIVFENDTVANFNLSMEISYFSLNNYSFVGGDIFTDNTITTCTT